MSAPIHIEGPYRSRRSAKRARWLVVAMAGLLLAVPLLVTAAVAIGKG